MLQVYWALWGGVYRGKPFSCMSSLYPSFVIFHFVSGIRVNKWNFPELYTTSGRGIPLSSPVNSLGFCYARPIPCQKKTSKKLHNLGNMCVVFPVSICLRYLVMPPQLLPLLLSSRSELSPRNELWAKIILVVESPQQGAGGRGDYRLPPQASWPHRLTSL